MRARRFARRRPELRGRILPPAGRGLFSGLEVGAILAPFVLGHLFPQRRQPGFPVLNLPGLDRLLAENTLASGDIIRLDVKAGRGENLTRKIEFPLDPMSGVQYDIYRAGDLFKYGKAAGLKKD